MSERLHPNLPSQTDEDLAEQPSVLQLRTCHPLDSHFLSLSSAPPQARTRSKLLLVQAMSEPACKPVGGLQLHLDQKWLRPRYLKRPVQCGRRMDHRSLQPCL